ncbi:MAG: hypothetical protein Q8J74_07585, partial [Candidatus Didemnitutus sp.]|nr:hypothetical protein [Candidatus Didemnitutus sp.]
HGTIGINFEVDPAALDPTVASDERRCGVPGSIFGGIHPCSLHGRRAIATYSFPRGKIDASHGGKKLP